MLQNAEAIHPSVSESANREKRIAIILNGASLKKKSFYAKILPTLSSIHNILVHETKSSTDAAVFASQATDDGVDAIIAAGGDGTLHQVVNGILHKHERTEKLPAVGLLPIGSANDFAQTLHLTNDPERLNKLLLEFNPKPVDVGKLKFENDSQYFINIADTGMGPDVAARVNKGGRTLFPGWRYYSSILKTFLTYSPMEVEVKTETWNWAGRIRTLAVANGKCFGHGLIIAPDAAINDGLFSVFIAEDVSVFDFIRHSESLKRGSVVNHHKIHYKQARSMEISSPQNRMIEADGELINYLPVRIEMLSNRLSFLY